MRRAIVAAWIACLLLAGALVAAGGGDSRHAAGPAPGGSVGLRIPMHDAAVCGRHAASLTECGRFGGAADQDDFR
jgi:hypothetical protein